MPAKLSASGDRRNAQACESLSPHEDLNAQPPLRGRPAARPKPDPDPDLVGSALGGRAEWVGYGTPMEGVRGEWESLVMLYSSTTR